MKILVRGVAPGSSQEVVECTSDADFLVHGVTNGIGSYSIGVGSTGAANGTTSPTFVVGGIPNDVVTIIIQPGTTAFITMETADGATASIS